MAGCASWTPTGELLADGIDPRDYADYIGEAVEPWSYLKSTYWKPLGISRRASTASGRWRALNVADQMGTPRADQELAEFRAPPRTRAHQLLPLPLRAPDRDPVRHRAHRGAAAQPGHPLARACESFAGINRNEGIGVSEAPRGTLIHHYKVDDDGIIQWANLVIATGHNNLAMNRSVLQVAQRFVKSAQLTEACSTGWRRSSAATTRASRCSTHALGRDGAPPPAIGPDGTVLDECKR